MEGKCCDSALGGVVGAGLQVSCTLTGQGSPKRLIVRMQGVSWPNLGG